MRHLEFDPIAGPFPLVRSVLLPGIFVCLVAAWAQAGQAHDHAHCDHEHSHGHSHEHSHGPAHAASTGAAGGGSLGVLDQRGWILLGGYSVLIVLASMIGGALPGRINLTHTRMQHMISFVGGLMLGIGVFHLFPHALHHLPNVDLAVMWMMGGIVFMFFLLRAFHFHQHDFPEINDALAAENTGFDTAIQQTLPPPAGMHDHDHDHDHDHGPAHSHGPAHTHVHEMGWVGVFLGLGLHTLIDGLALGASIQAELGHVAGFALCGLGTFAAIALHKPLDAISITSLMVAGGWSRSAQMVVNGLFATLCPLGAVLFVLGARSLLGNQDLVIGAALAFAAGVFICISLSDLLPEMEFHSHHRKTLTFALLLGICLAWGLRYLEPAHVHG